MTLTVQIRLTSAFLGELPPDQNKIRRFRRTVNQLVEVNQNQWRSTFAIAAKDLGLNVDIRRTVLPPEGLIAASVHLYRRVYSKVYVDLFESFRARTILTFDLRILDDLPRHPTRMEMAGILRYTGQYLGLSPFGSVKFGFGRFELLTFEPVNPTIFLNPDEPSTHQNSVPTQPGGRSEAVPSDHSESNQRYVSRNGDSPHVSFQPADVHSPRHSQNHSGNL